MSLSRTIGCDSFIGTSSWGLVAVVGGISAALRARTSAPGWIRSALASLPETLLRRSAALGALFRKVHILKVTQISKDGFACVVGFGSPRGLGQCIEASFYFAGRRMARMLFSPAIGSMGVSAMGGWFPENPVHLAAMYPSRKHPFAALRLAGLFWPARAAPRDAGARPAGEDQTRLGLRACGAVSGKFLSIMRREPINPLD